MDYPTARAAAMEAGEVEQGRMDVCVHALTELADPAAVATAGGRMRTTGSPDGGEAASP
ncbi:hypothetical protein ACFWIN_25295 [Streptomyces sp. NPDC127049]|uniref:hypothetical protein n=1 Tax=Streptomyces sp. NPDC127049 TaxID=3347118 RepID=UPI003648ECFA